MNSTLLAEPILVGREQELKNLQRYLDLAIEGKGTTVFVSGEAGTGKTRLVREFLASANQKKEITSLNGWCLSNAGVPYFPFIEAFSTYFSTLGKKSDNEELELNFWLKGPSRTGLSGELVYLSPQALKDQTFAAVAKALLGISASKPTILFIDDVHWADSASLALLHYVARAVTCQRVLVLATFRCEELNVTGEGYLHPLVETLRLMGRENLFKEVKLGNLRSNDVLSLAQNMVGGHLQSEFADRLVNESKGNPLFIVESVRMLVENGTLVQENNQWRLAADEIDIPAKVKDIILNRVGALKPEHRKMLDLASVLGFKFDPELLGVVLGKSTLEVLETLDHITHRSSLVVCEGNDYRFDHVKSRDAIYGVLSFALKGAYHGLVADKLEAGGEGGKTSVVDLAYHYSQAGNKQKAVKYALAAGQDALAKWSNLQAIQHFTYVLQNISAEQIDENRTALEGLGDAYAAICMYGEAIKTFDKLAAFESGRLQLRALRKAMDAAFFKGDKPDILLEYAKKAEELAAYDRLEMARVLDSRGRAFSWAGRGDVSLDLADYEAALRVFEEENSLADQAEAMSRIGEVHASFEDLQERGLVELLCAFAIYRDIGDLRKEIQATLLVSYGLIQNGLFQEARRELAKVLTIGEKLGIFVELARAKGMLGLLDEYDGKLMEALSEVLRALECYKMTDASYVQGLDFAALTRLYSRLGDLKRADEYFYKLTNLSRDVLLNPMVSSLVLISKGVYFAAKGRWQESNQAFEEAAKLRWGGFDGSYAWALERQGRVEETRIQRDKTQRMLTQVEERFRHARMQMYFFAPRKVYAGKEFETRLYIINIAKNPGTLVKLEGLASSGSKVVSLPSFCSIKNSLIVMKKKVEPFGVESIKLRMAFVKAGGYDFRASLYYVDDLGEIKMSEAEPVTITAKLASLDDKLKSVVQPMHWSLRFDSEAAEKAFNFLVSAFKDDYLRRRLSQEKSGWRTLMEIVKKGQVSMNSMYGRSGRGGKARLELGRLGLVETRFFSGERGRGGSVLKMRIQYENEPVKQWVDKQSVEK